MIKKVLSSVLVFSMLFSLTAMASIDTSVFESKDIYKIEIDDFDDTGEITFVSTDDNKDAPSNLIIGAGGEDSSDEGAIMGNFDIKMLDSPSLAVMRITLLYMGEDWIFTDDMIIKTNKHRYTFPVDRQAEAEGGKVYEMYTLVITDKSRGLLEDLIEDGGSAEYRLSGDRKVDGKLLLSEDALKTMYDDYTEAGGFDQNFTTISTSFPCETKDLE